MIRLRLWIFTRRLKRLLPDRVKNRKMYKNLSESGKCGNLVGEKLRNEYLSGYYYYEK
jgi:hypothetical protein